MSQIDEHVLALRSMFHRRRFTVQNSCTRARVSWTVRLRISPSWFHDVVTRLVLDLRENITVELRQDKIEGDPEWRATVVRCITECMRE